MTSQLQSSKIDGLTSVGLAAGEEATQIEGVAAVGISGGMEVTKIDSFTSLLQISVQHEHIASWQWIGPPKPPGT